MRLQMTRGTRTTLSMVIALAAAAPLLADPAGREIMEEQKARHETRTEASDEIMLLVDKDGNKEQRLLKNFAMKVKEDETRFLVVFHHPASVRGTALLTWDYEKRDNDQWLYLPAQKKMRRVAGNSRQGYFMGTDFTFEDLDPEDIDNFEYRVLREEAVEGQECWVIEALPSSDEAARSSGYNRRLLWVRKDIYFTVRIDFYNKRNVLIKTQTNHDLINIEGELWRCQKILMNNLEKEHKTLLGVKSRRINESINSEIFTERFILSERHLQLD
jgi:hypothetical protein